MSTPPAEIQEALKLIKVLVNRLIDVVSQVPNLGQFESDVVVVNLLQLLIKHIEGILHIAEHDLLLLPPVLVICRAAIETFVNIIWLLNQEDPFQREIYLLAFLKEEKQGYTEYIKNLTDMHEDTLSIEIDKENIQKYYDKIKSKIPSDYVEIAKPNFRDLLRSLNLENIYPTYRILSKYTHGTHSATWLYKRTLDEGEEFGERIEPSDWHTPLFICWYTLAETGCQLLNRFGGKHETFLLKHIKQEFEQALAKIKR